jgi:uncharacterized protein (DUF4415 family)
LIAYYPEGRDGTPRSKDIMARIEKSMASTPRRPVSAKDAAEALFKPVKKPAAPAVERRAPPEARELVSIKLDSTVLEFFQQGGPGWQDRINDTLRAVMQGKPVA